MKDIKNVYTRWLRHGCFLSILLILPSLSSFLYAQETTPLINSTLDGRLLDSLTNEPLVSATVQIKGVTHQTKTDANGSFRLITGQKFPYTLVISSIGYKSKEIRVDKSPILIAIAPDATQLEDVVIVGYGEQRKSNLVGAVSKINPEQVKNIPEASFDTQIQGSAAGVQINGGTGIPGSNTFIRIRGATSINSSNDPLYIIDGIFVNNASLQTIAADRTTSPLADLNPNDIETIEILKDATAVSIYGSRGANGVVIITTKRGKLDQQVKIDFSASQGAGWAPKNRWWKLTSGPEHAMLVEEYRKNEGLPSVFTSEGRGLPEDQKTYDRQSILNQTAHYQNYNLSINGGSQQTSYYIGLGFDDQEGIWKTMGFNRASLKLNLDQKISNKVKIGTSNTLSRSHRNIGRAVGSGGTGALYQATVDIPTYLPIFDDDGTPLRWVNFDNIYSLVTETDNGSNSNHYIGNLYGEIAFNPYLTFRTSFSLDYNLYEEKEYWNTNLLRGIANNGEATTSFTQSSFWVNEQTLRYARTLKEKHHIGILIGTHLESNILANTTSRGTNFPNNSFKLISAAANHTVTESWGKNNLVSFFSRLEYSYQDKYLLEVDFRADGSSKFSPEQRWGYFPAIGGAWKINEESFLKNSDVVSTLKLRTNYGIAGNQNGINDFAYRGLWTAGSGYPDEGSAELPGTNPLQLSNQQLSWEKTSQFNIGLDIGLFKDRLNIETNYYRKYTTDALLQVSVPNYTGFKTYLTNYGELSNNGVELAVNSVNITKPEFEWNTSFNISHNKNRIEVLPSPMSFEDRQFIRIEQGKPLYSYWLYNFLGVDPQTGDVVIEDVNQDGQITANDRKVVGDAWPKFFGGLNNTFRFKNFDANILFTFSYGNHVWNHNRALGEQGGSLDANRVIFASQLDRWQQPGDITDVPRLALKNYNRQELSRFFEDASFLRLRTLTIGYTLPKKLTQKASIERLRLYFVGTNLWLLTKYSGADPETRLERGESQNIQGYDFASPPTPRSIQFGVNLTL